MNRAFNLLIVDDDIGQVRLLEVLMKELNQPHRLHHVPDGTKALDFLYSRPPYELAPRPQLILLDLNMAGMNGCEVLREIKGDPELRAIPVIILSSSQSRTDIDACYGERANAYISKPSDLDSNLQLLREIDRFWMQTARLPD